MMWPPIGIIAIDSKPPASATWALPVRMRSAAMAIDCNPEEQNRLMVMALVSTGRPARIAAARAMFMPCSASGIAQPMITSSISDISRPGTRAIASLITAAPISSGRVFFRVPFGALPIAVRTADTMTASLIVFKKSEFRTQDSEVAHDRLRIACEQTTHFLECLVQLFSVAIAEIGNQDQVIATLFQRSVCDVHESRFVLLAFFLKALSNIRVD